MFFKVVFWCVVLLVRSKLLIYIESENGNNVCWLGKIPCADCGEGWTEARDKEKPGAVFFIPKSAANWYSSVCEWHVFWPGCCGCYLSPWGCTARTQGHGGTS